MNAEYEEFLRGNEWRKFAADVKKDSGYQCELCGSSERLEVHHIIYDHKTNLMNKQDVICLCKRCHVASHRMLAKYKETFKYPQMIDKEELKEFLGSVFTDFYFNSYCGIGTDSPINLLEIEELRKLGTFILKSIDAQYGKYHHIQVYYSGGIFYDTIIDAYYIDIARRKIVEERNRMIKDAVLDGFPEYTIKKRFKMNYNSWQKAMSHIEWK